MHPRAFRSALVLVFTAGFILAWACTGRTDDKAGELMIRPEWKVGDHFRYERVKTRRKIQGGKQTLAATARGPIDIEVAEAGEKGFLVRWRIGETTPDDPKLAADPNVRALSRLVEGLALDLELDNEATLTGIRNWIEIKAAGVKIADNAMKSLPAGTNAKALAGARATMDAMLATRERIEQLFAREPQAFFQPIGRTYPGVGKSVEYDDHLPNPLGGPAFPCKGKITLTSYDPAKGRAVVSWTQVADPKETARILIETMNAIAKKTGNPLPKSEDFKSLQFEDRTEFVIDARTGWVEEFTHTRSTSSQGNTQEDILSMTRQTKAK